MNQTAGIERGPSGRVYTCVGFNSDGGCATSGYFVYGKDWSRIPICVLCMNPMVRAQCDQPACTAEATRINVRTDTGVLVARCECH